MRIKEVILYGLIVLFLIVMVTMHNNIVSRQRSVSYEDRGH